jgi:hypothetical protein
MYNKKVSPFKMNGKKLKSVTILLNILKHFGTYFEKRIEICSKTFYSYRTDIDRKIVYTSETNDLLNLRI